jgi:hypothetical protein
MAGLGDIWGTPAYQSTWGTDGYKTDGWTEGDGHTYQMATGKEDDAQGTYASGRGQYSAADLKAIGYDVPEYDGSYQAFRDNNDSAPDQMAGLPAYLASKGYTSRIQQGESGTEQGFFDANGKQIGTGNRYGNSGDDAFAGAFGLGALVSGAGIAGLGGLGAGAGGGLATDATGATVAAGAAGPGYGAAGYEGATLGGYGSAAGKGALFNGGKTALMGGDFKDVAKSALWGAAGGAAGAGMADLNPAGSVGITDPQYAKYVNGGLTSAGMTAARGGNVGQSLLSSGVTDGVSMGLQAGYGGLQKMFNGSDFNEDYSNEGNNYPAPAETSSPASSGSPLNDYMNSLRGYSAPAPGTEMGQYVNAPLTSPDAQQPSMDYSPDTGGAVSFANNTTGTGENPYKAMLVKALGINSAGSNTPGNFDNMAANLMQLYQSRKNAKQAGGMADSLQGMYGQNSPYSQVLQETLMRQDAKAGRRSQVGPRSVELQARLADLNSRNAPEIARLRATQQNNQGQALQSVLRMGAPGLVQRGWQGLSGMYAPQTQDNNGYGGYGTTMYGDGYGPQ